MNLNVVIGPMFSGKSTFIINKTNSLLLTEYIALKPLIDDRYNKTDIVTHNKEKINAFSTNNLVKFFKKNNIKKYKNIFIDEAQFFNDLVKAIEFLDYINYKGNIYVCGLNGDFKRKSIGQIHNIISRANNIIHLKGKCFRCKRDSSFSLKIDGNESQIDVGGADKYQPVCGNCYQHFQEISSCHKPLNYFSKIID